MGIPFSANIHASPTDVRVSPGVASALTISFGKGGGYPEVTVFCDTAEMAADLNAAISGVINKHKSSVALDEREAA